MSKIISQTTVNTIYVEVFDKYKNQQKRELASEALEDFRRFVNTLPPNTYTKKEVKGFLKAHSGSYLRKVVSEEKNNRLKPKGFITFTFLATAIVSGIISWVVRRILDRLVLDSQKHVSSSD